jgi:hypothetical protein
LSRRQLAASLKELQKKAAQYDSELAVWQERVRTAQARQLAPFKSNNTGTRGISHGFRYESRSGRLFKYPGFVVNARDPDGKAFKRVFLISVHGYEGAWHKAFKFLLEKKGLPATPKREILKAMPSKQPPHASRRNRRALVD